MKPKINGNRSTKYNPMSKVLLTLLFFGSIITYSLAQAPAIEWQKSLGGSEFDAAKDIGQTADGGYIVSGATNSNNGDISGNHGDYDFWVAKLNSSGTMQWQRSSGSGGREWLRSTLLTPDGGCISVGDSNANGGDVTGNHGDADVWVIKLDATGFLQWSKSLGGSSVDIAYAINEATDGGYIIAGSTASTDGDVTSNQGMTDVWVVKIDLTGALQWQKTFGGSGTDTAKSIEPTIDGGYILTGSTNSNDGDISSNNGAQDVWVVKIDVNGNLIWEDTFGGSSNDAAESIKETADGGYIVCGSTLSNDGDVTGNNGSIDSWLVKLNIIGTLQWQKTLGGSEFDALEDVQLTPNGKYVVTGTSQSIDGDITGNHGLFDVWTALISNTGNLQWQRSLGGSNNDLGSSIRITSDGGYIMAGESSSNNGDVSGNHGMSDFWVVKLAPDPLTVTDFNTTEIILYPNPVSSMLHIEGQENIENIQVFNLLGQQLMEQSVNTLNTTLNMSSFSAGMYVVHIVSNHQTQTYRIVKH